MLVEANCFVIVAVEQALPVQSTIPPRREDARMALLLVIDISQSMDRMVDGVTSISMAKQAAILSEQSLRDDDQIGVLIFNHRFSWLQPIGRLSTRLRTILIPMFWIGFAGNSPAPRPATGRRIIFTSRIIRSPFETGKPSWTRR